MVGNVERGITLKILYLTMTINRTEMISVKMDGIMREQKLIVVLEIVMVCRIFYPK